MLDDLWSGLIAFTEQFVVPDWGALVLLLPVFLAVLVILYLTWVIYRLATAGPTRRGVRRVPPAPPAGIHMPGPSFAPLLGALGVFMLVFGMVAGGLWLWVGLAILVITLLYWGREAIRDYDRIPAASTEAAAVGALPAPAGQPPAGVHVPPPTFRPILVAVSMTLLVAGMVAGGWALLFGLLAVVLVLLGWLNDARREYAATEAADSTGHLDLGRAPAGRSRLAALGLIVAGALLLSSGLPAQLQGGTTRPAARRPPPGWGHHRDPSAHHAGRGRRAQRREHRLGRVVDHRACGQGVHDRVRQPRQGHPARHGDQGRVGQGAVHGRSGDRSSDRGLPCAGPPRRAIPVRVLVPSQHDGDRHGSVGPATLHPSPLRPRLAALAAVFVLSVAACGASSGQAQTGKAVPPIGGTTLDGTTIDLAAYRGHPVVVNFWASWCTPCREEFPLFADRLATLGPSDGLVMLGVLYKDDPGLARNFLGELGATWPTVTDPDGALAAAYRVVAPPQTYFIDSDGVLRGIQIGEVRPEDFDTQYAKIAP
jgi:cytochrome c biogenesis protein CcmG/thiol:disulfide interchange protein DsbE